MRKITVCMILVILFTASIFLTSCNREYADYSADVTTFMIEDDGEFKILTVSDLHFCNYESGEEQFDEDMLNRLDKLIKHSEPDLIVILGDMVYSHNSSRVDALGALAEIIDGYKIPWAPVYGNHDGENPSGSTSRADFINNKTAMNAILAESEYCLFKEGPEDINGYGNYIINITDENNKIIQTLFFLDSGDYIKPEDLIGNDFIPQSATHAMKNYGAIYPNQIQWYEDTVKDISKFIYGRRKKVVPSLAFFHIPFPEYRTVWELYDQGSDKVKWYDGALEEPDMGNGGVASPSFNTGMFNKMVELKSTKAVFVGHDHGNDFSIKYKGVRLNYNGGMRHITYMVTDEIIESMFGGREIIIDERGNCAYNRVKISDITE